MRTQPFDYALEALLQQAKWQLDASLAELADAARELQERRASAQEHQRHVEATLDWMKPQSVVVLDPVVARNRVAYLSQAADTTASFERDVKAAEANVERLQACCRDKQLRLDAIEQHRSDTAKDHRQAQAHTVNAQADDDWLMRSRWAARANR